jgi:hypothetical protein
MKTPKKKSAKKSAKKRHVAPRVRLFVSPEWQHACEEIISAYGAEELNATISTFGAPEITRAVTRDVIEVTALVRQAIKCHLPEAMALYDSEHPPCPRRAASCMRGAILQVLAFDRFNSGDAPNPSVEYRLMNSVVARYLKSLS